MLFAAKTKGFFLQQDDHSLLLARTSAPVPPMVVEEMIECPAGDQTATAEALKRLKSKKQNTRYVHATCGVHPTRSVLRRATLDPKRLKEPGYLAEILSGQFRVEADSFTVHVLNANDGADFDAAKGTQKDVLFCGIPTEEVVSIQNALLEKGIYPEQLQLGAVATLGAVVDYLKFTGSKTPTLVLEIDSSTTHSYIVSAGGVEVTRPIAQGLDSMVPVVQKELGLKDEESARKLFFSNTFDFAGMGPLLVKKLLKELQSSIGFYEVQTGQSVGQLLCTSIPPKLAWLDGVIASSLGISALRCDFAAWLQAKGISLPDGLPAGGLDARWVSLLSLMISHHSTDAILPEKKE